LSPMMPAWTRCFPKRASSESVSFPPTIPGAVSGADARAIMASAATCSFSSQHRRRQDANSLDGGKRLAELLKKLPSGAWSSKAVPTAPGSARANVADLGVIHDLYNRCRARWPDGGRTSKPRIASDSNRPTAGPEVLNDWNRPARNHPAGS